MIQSICLICGHLLQTTTEPDKKLKDKSEKVISLHKTDNNNKKAALKTMSIQNCDFAGWLSIPNTTIDYPVMQNQNNFFHLLNNLKIHS